MFRGELNPSFKTSFALIYVLKYKQLCCENIFVDLFRKRNYLTLKNLGILTIIIIFFILSGKRHEFSITTLLCYKA